MGGPRVAVCACEATATSQALPRAVGVSVVRSSLPALLSRCCSCCRALLGSIVESSSSIDLRHFSLHPWKAVTHRAACSAGCWRFTSPCSGPPRSIFAAPPPRAGACRRGAWNCAAAAGAVADRRPSSSPSSAPRATAPAAARVAALDRRRARRRARRVAHLEPVSPRDRGGADPRAVRRVPDPGAAALPVDQFLRRARHARLIATQYAVRGAEPRAALQSSRAGEARDRRHRRHDACPISSASRPPEDPPPERRARSSSGRQTALGRER